VYMNIEDCRNKYYYNSRKAGDICRNLGLAGLALIWAFRVATPDGVVIPQDMRWAGILLVAGLGFDFLQYVIGAIIWGIYQYLKEKQVSSENVVFGAPGWINLPTNFLFYLKLIAIAFAYIFITISMFGSFWL